MKAPSANVTPEIIGRFLSSLEVSRTTPRGRPRRDDAVALTCLRQFGNLLTLVGDLDGVHYENDPLLLFLIRPPDVALCVQARTVEGSLVSVTMARTDIQRSLREVRIDARKLPGSLLSVCSLIAEWITELR